MVFMYGVSIYLKLGHLRYFGLYIAPSKSPAMFCFSNQFVMKQNIAGLSKIKTKRYQTAYTLVHAMRQKWCFINKELFNVKNICKFFITR